MEPSPGPKNKPASERVKLGQGGRQPLDRDFIDE
jgi:hypothetical protein